VDVLYFLPTCTECSFAFRLFLFWGVSGLVRRCAGIAADHLAASPPEDARSCHILEV